MFSRAFPSEACRIYCVATNDPVFKWRPLLTSEAVTEAEAGFARSKTDERFETDAYFPEGTWCHRDSRQIDYFCRNRECQPHY